MRYVLLALALVSLTGCGLWNTRETKQEASSSHITGTFAGHPVVLDVSTKTEGQAQSQAGVEPGGALSIIQALLGGLGGGTGIMALVLAFTKHREAQSYKADAAEGWDKALQSRPA